METTIFIPILTIPGLMGTTKHQDYYKEYNYYRGDKSVLYNRSYDINCIGRSLIHIIIKPDIERCKKDKENNKTIPFLALTGLIDTGAGISAIKPTKENIEYLGVESFPGLEITGLNTLPKKYENLNLSIHIQNIFPDYGFLNICPIISEWHKDEPFDFIIGWDILRFCNLSYVGSERKFKLEFIENSNNK